MRLTWHRFADFDIHGLYRLLAFRQEVFVVEQASPFADLDFQDQDAWHLLAFDGESLVGCARVLAPSPSRGGAASFGRLVAAPSQRGTGLGRRMIGACLERLAADHPAADVVISAQSHLQDYYGRFGFRTESEPYDDGGILHVDMRLRR